jgi:anti-sigma regulatory factor (Ser/Thr protein kinase)
VAPAGWESPSADRPTLRGTLAAVPASAGLARLRCAEFAESIGASIAAIDAIKLSVSEAITNIVLYAYPNGRTGMAHVTAKLERPDLLSIVVEDDGVGMNASRPGGEGHGLRLIENLAAEMDIVSSGETGTRIEMTFELA